MWYVIQTQTGKEKRTKDLIERMVPSELYSEVRILYYETKRKYQGEWHLEQKTMFPGYLFLITDQIEEIFLYLRKVPELTKVLGYGDDVVPISEKEEAFLTKISGGGNIVEMSYGIQVGDKIIVKEGILKGLESVIRKIDRHKRKALIEIEMLGEIRQVEIGLEITQKL